MTEGLPPRHALATFIDSYVSAAHRDDPSRGCPVVMLNSDLPRQSKKFRNVFDSGVRQLAARLAEMIRDAGIDAANDNGETLAASLLSAMAGAVAVSRAVSDKRLSDEMLEAARASIKTRLGLTDVALSGGARQ
jgi:TetR/AcrR family transcriptional regulator, transcriptional repressor for nem operon